MHLPYPVTSYAGRVVDLTGGRLDKFEGFVIRAVSRVHSFVVTYNSLNKLNARELADIGLNRDDIFKVSAHAIKHV